MIFGNGGVKLKHGMLLIASLAFGLYVICPRMSAMLHEQGRVRNLNVHAVIVLGALISIPLFVLLLYILVNFGLGWAIIFAAIGDFAAAALLGTIDAKTGVELAIITIFVYVGIRLAPVISNILFQLSGT
jgi:uncharacterized iron-regulated membrane protein